MKRGLIIILIFLLIVLVVPPLYALFESKLIITLNKDLLSQNELLIIDINPTYQGFYSVVYILNNNKDIVDSINLNCNRGICHNKEIINYYIPSNFNGQYTINVFDYSILNYETTSFNVVPETGFQAAAFEGQAIANAGPDQTVNVGEVVFFDATSSLDYTNIVDYYWDFDDSLNGIQNDSIAAFTYTRYNNVGIYTATLTIIDKNNVKSTDTTIITVQNAPPIQNIYHVGPGQIYATIQSCANTAQAGDVCLVHAGIYNENIVVSNSGQLNNPIIFKVNEGDSVIIQPTVAYSTAINVNSDYIVFDGFEFNGNDIAGFGFRVQPSASNILLKNCKIHNFVNNPSTGTKEGWGVYIGSENNPHTSAPKTYVTISNCEVYNNEERNIVVKASHNLIEYSNIHHPLGSGQHDDISFNGAGYGNILYGNFIHDNVATGAHSDLIEIYGAENVLIERNILQDASTEAIMADAAVRPSTDVNRNTVFINNIIDIVDDTEGFYELQIHDSPNMKIYNNVFASIVNGIRCSSPKGTESAYMQVRNNIFYNCNKGFEYNGCEGYTLSNNDYYNCGTLSDNLDSAAAGSIILNPNFVDAANYDYHLQSASPAIDAGTSIVGMNTDKDGNSRPSGVGYDIGAYEYQGQQSCPLCDLTNAYWSLT